MSKTEEMTWDYSCLDNYVNEIDKQLSLPNAEDGKVVTRFPPEPSGFMHIGHVKAALINDYFAKKYHGKLLIRMDDTNPTKEKQDFEDAILQDCKTLDIIPYKTSHTSDHFATLLSYADKLIELGLAYVDDTSQEQMRDERMKGIASKNRDKSVEQNKTDWESMKTATDGGLKSCLRAKISVDDKNKCLRDPVIYRCNLTPHHISKTKYKVYPTYDFACPVVDSIEGVTHAMRTNEYRDRLPQYEWFIEKLELRPVTVSDFSRLNFVYTLLSKRKLQWFVDTKKVESWFDPRFPTVQGIMRRGLTVEGLRTFILMQGNSSKSNLCEWDKIWALNKKILDLNCPRLTALDSEESLVELLLEPDSSAMEDPLGNLKNSCYIKELPSHQKNESLGNRKVPYYSTVLIEKSDAESLVIDEEVTLMNWGNVKITSIEKSANNITVRGCLNLGGDYKKTKKLTWLAKASEHEYKVVNLVLADYDYLINKPKPEEDDKIEDILSEKTEFLVSFIHLD
eukprot:NODE_138_length_16264_cov_1.140860.p4 type:complete len:510 gc:universal NODE_138_length_16264_cov_1.140860:10989-9460(-)